MPKTPNGLRLPPDLASPTKNKKQTLLRVLNLGAIVFGCLLVLAVGMLLYNHLRSQKDQAAFRELSAMVQTQEPVQASPEDPTAPTQALEISPCWVLYDQNPDFAAWLTIAGTVVDYPVMSTAEDPEHYLYRGFDGKHSPSGTPFVGAYGSLDTQQCIIYAHNMKDGTMFHSLLDYADPEYLRAHPTFTLTTLEDQRTYEIFSAVETRVLTPSEPGLRYYRLEEGVEQWLVDNALYDTGIDLKADDQILILSTCSYHTDQGRFIIAGRLAESKPFAPRS